MHWRWTSTFGAPVTQGLGGDVQIFCNLLSSHQSGEVFSVNDLFLLLSHTQIVSGEVCRVDQQKEVEFLIVSQGESGHFNVDFTLTFES